jgi:hypothetical protein
MNRPINSKQNNKKPTKFPPITKPAPYKKPVVASRYKNIKVIK